ncbi:hypothetical protein A2U01_0052264, partial [Trifolium medium]|nr:hypothetical protein [Trifolium medium]
SLLGEHQRDKARQVSELQGQWRALAKHGEIQRVCLARRALPSLGEPSTQNTKNTPLA